MNIETIRHEVLSLPAQERAQLAEQLLLSLDDLSEVEIEQLWFKKAARPATEVDQGRGQLIPAEVLQEVRLLLKPGRPE